MDLQGSPPVGQVFRPGTGPTESGAAFKRSDTKRFLLGIPRFVSKGEPRPWTQKEEALLGTDVDFEIARRLKRTTVATTKRRQFLKIPHFWDRPWTAEDDKLLGTTTDRQAAHELGRSKRQVIERRRMLGIPRFIYTPRHWTSGEELMLGEASDYVVAKRLHRTLTSVIAKREVLGIPPYRLQYRQWTEEEIRVLGEKPDAEVARLVGRSLDAVRLQRRLRRIPGVDDLLAAKAWTPSEEKLLGKLSDEEVAKRTDRKVSAVRESTAEEEACHPLSFCAARGQKRRRSCWALTPMKKSAVALDATVPQWEIVADSLEFLPKFLIGRMKNPNCSERFRTASLQSNSAAQFFPFKIAA